MTEESSGSFSAFWQRSVDKVSSKTVKFMPNVTKPDDDKDGDEGEPSTLTAKQRRRQQVRRAQKEHRQRKENYVKHLEQDVIDLREMIATAETQSVLFKHENKAIRDLLTGYNVPIPIIEGVTSETANQGSRLDSFDPDLQVPQGDIGMLDFTYPPLPRHSSSSNDSLVSINFDEIIDTNRLYLSQPKFNSRLPVPTTSPGAPHFASNALSSSSSSLGKGQTLNLTPDLSKALPALPNSAISTSVVPPIDLSTIAINFILALEHPCRTHFHPHSDKFDPLGKPSGHELMASTLLYDHAPESIFTSPSFADPALSPTPGQTLEWTVPSLELSRLHEMSQSLPKGDWEITPVQAWFKLAERFSVETLLGKGTCATGETVLDHLKREIAPLVDCFHFGAMMEEARFWEVVDEVLGSEFAGGSGGRS